MTAVDFFTGRAPQLALACLALATFAAPALRGTAAAATTLCTQNPGGRVVLESDAVDPDVFLWDSRTRLVDYAAGQWGNTRAIFAHTVLAEPGTRAAVVACVPAAAHPKYSTGDEDAIGVKIMSGPYKGRYGWVLSSDIHPSRTPAGQSAVNPPSKN
jgi:hypothetical protein